MPHDKMPHDNMPSAKLHLRLTLAILGLLNPELDHSLILALDPSASDHVWWVCVPHSSLSRDQILVVGAATLVAFPCNMQSF